MNLYSPGLGHSHVSPCPSVLRSQEMCQADSGGSDLGCGLGSILCLQPRFLVLLRADLKGQHLQGQLCRSCAWAENPLLFGD